MHVVLFVDDEPAVLEALRRSLWRAPYEVLTAGSALDGLRLLAERVVNVVVSDERMPGLSGSEFLERVRARYPEVVRIMLTGETGLPATVRAIERTAVYRFLNKPLSPAALRDTLARAVHMQEIAREASLVPR